MKKVTLDLANLKVDSFSTLSAPRQAGGTVHGNQETRTDLYQLSCHNACNASANPTCDLGWTCANTCYLGQHGCATMGADETCAAANPICPV
jgi:hypothetical protein